MLTNASDCMGSGAGSYHSVKWGIRVSFHWSLPKWLHSFFKLALAQNDLVILSVSNNSFRIQAKILYFVRQRTSMGVRIFSLTTQLYKYINLPDDRAWTLSGCCFAIDGADALRVLACNRVDQCKRPAFRRSYINAWHHLLQWNNSLLILPKWQTPTD